MAIAWNQLVNEAPAHPVHSIWPKKACYHQKLSTLLGRTLPERAALNFCSAFHQPLAAQAPSQTYPSSIFPAHISQGPLSRQPLVLARPQLEPAHLPKFQPTSPCMLGRPCNGFSIPRKAAFYNSSLTSRPAAVPEYHGVFRHAEAQK